MPTLNMVPKGLSLRRTYSNAGSFPLRFGSMSPIYAHSQQSDGKVIIVGDVVTYNDITTFGVARIDPITGDLDTAFATNIGGGANTDLAPSLTIYSVYIQPDGKILLGGVFDLFNGVYQKGLVRLNSDGTPDTAFNANVVNLINTPSGEYISSIALQSNGSIILGGNFTTLTDETSNVYTVGKICKLNSDGTIDGEFKSGLYDGPNDTVIKVVVQSNDSILVGGSFTSWLSNNSLVSANRFVRLYGDGSLDNNFNTAIGDSADGVVRAIALQSNGSIVIGGDFSSFNGTSCKIARIGSGGTFDSSFNTNVGSGPGEFILSISVQSDGKILVGGSFETWSGTSIRDIVRLNSDGTLDTAFRTANGSGASSYGQIRVASQLANGDIIVAGDSFSSWNGTAVDNIITLSSSGVKNTKFLQKPQVVFAILAGAGGGVADTTNAALSSGGGAGAVVWGMVPFQSTAVIGAGGRGDGGQSRYSTLIASGGRAGAINTNGGAGTQGSAGSGGSHLISSTSGATRVGGAGSTLFNSVGAAGGICSAPSSGDSVAQNGFSGTSGGGGGGASYGVTSGTGSVTAGDGGSGLAGGGGGGAGTNQGATAGSVLGGAGGNGVYPGGTRVLVTGTNAYRYSAGGGGGGLLGPGGNGNSASGSNINRSAQPGQGGLGGGGAGGGVGDYQSDQGANGGNGALLLYW